MGKDIRPRPISLRDLSESLSERYPELIAISQDGVVTIKGSFPIVYEGEVLDRFFIELTVAKDFPYSVPTLRETGGRVPRELDRHVNASGEACLLVPEEWLILPREERTIVRFLDGPVRDFFLFQALKERGQSWPGGERPHGRAGLLQSYAEMIEVAEDLVPAYLYCLSRKELKGHLDCPCGSGRRLRSCHLEQIRALRDKISVELAKSAEARLRSMK
jgi:hypothetical protein